MKNLIFDVFSGLLFMVVLLLTKNIYAALTVALVAAVAQLIWSRAPIVRLIASKPAPAAYFVDV